MNWKHCKNKSIPKWIVIFDVHINYIEKDCMMIIILHGALLSQALTDSVRKQNEKGQIVKDNGGCFTWKILFTGTFDVCFVIFLKLFLS